MSDAVTEPKRVGRPSSYTPEVASVICQRLANGEPLMSVCRDEDMPDRRTVTRWLLKPERDDFRLAYARAREMQAEVLADEVVTVADLATNKDNAHAIDVRVKARQWFASKLLPKRYGDRLQVEGNVLVNLDERLRRGRARVEGLKKGRDGVFVPDQRDEDEKVP